MNDLNSIIVEGRLVKDPVTGTGKNEKPYAFCTIASNRFYKKPEDEVWQEDTTFIDVRSFNGVSERLAEAKVGQVIRTVGRLAMEKDDEGKNRHYILLEHVDLK